MAKKIIIDTSNLAWMFSNTPQAWSKFELIIKKKYIEDNY